MYATSSMKTPGKSIMKNKTVRTHETDGEDHINIYFHGKTELGAMLTTAYRAQFVHPYFGPFNSVEGFINYVKSVSRDDELRGLWGNRVKDYVSQNNLKMGRVNNLTTLIEAANYYKISQNPELKKLFIESNLPFDHYYLFGPGKIAIRSNRSEQVAASFEKLRTLMKEGKPYPEPNYEKINLPL